MYIVNIHSTHNTQSTYSPFHPSHTHTNIHTQIRTHMCVREHTHTHTYTLIVFLIPLVFHLLGDFRPLNGITVKFFEDSQTAPFDVEVIDNNEYKGPRTFSIQFNILEVGTEKGNNSSTLITILEDDG